MFLPAVIAALFVGAVLTWLAAKNRSMAESAGLSAQLKALQQLLAEAQRRATETEQQLTSRTTELQDAREKLGAARASIVGFEAAVQERDQRLERFSTELINARDQNTRLQAELAKLGSALHEQKNSYELQMANLRDAEERLKNTFQSVAAEALKGNNLQFLTLAKSELEKQQQQAEGDLASRKKEVENLVKPISETLDKLGKEVREIETKREGAYGEIKTQIENLRLTGDQIKTEAARLVTALKMPQQRGRWGEIQLRRVVELAGMVRFCDFDEQVSVRDSEDNLQKPDMTVRLPGGRMIVVDSKVSLAAYLEAAACEDETQRAAKLKDHAGQIKSHLMRLSNKSYWSQFASAPEFVIAFLPGEAFFSAALQQDPTLIEFGAEQKVVLATPTTLIALLKAVAYGWRQEEVAKNAQQISELGKQLYERLATMYGYVADLRRSLDHSVKNFNKMTGTLESRVMVSARRFRELGATVSDEIAEVEPIETAPRDLNGAQPVVLRALAASISEENQN
jgi:DNA recombination protein RmuC